MLRKGRKSQTSYIRTPHGFPDYNCLETHKGEYTGLPDIKMGSPHRVTADPRDELHENQVENKTQYNNNKEWLGVYM